MHALSNTAGQCRLVAAAAAALVLHEVALAGGVALEVGGAGGDLAVARRLGAAPALQAQGRPRHRPRAASERHHHLLRRRPHRHHVVLLRCPA